MSILKTIFNWEYSALAKARIDPNLIDLEAQRIRLLFESLLKQGFTEDQAVQIVAGLGGKPQG